MDGDQDVRALGDATTGEVAAERPRFTGLLAQSGSNTLGHNRDTPRPCRCAPFTEKPCFLTSALRPGVLPFTNSKKWTKKISRLNRNSTFPKDGNLACELVPNFCQSLICILTSFHPTEQDGAECRQLRASAWRLGGSI